MCQKAAGQTTQNIMPLQPVVGEGIKAQQLLSSAQNRQNHQYNHLINLVLFKPISTMPDTMGQYATPCHAAWHRGMGFAKCDK